MSRVALRKYVKQALAAALHTCIATLHVNRECCCRHGFGWLIVSHSLNLA